MILSTAGSYLVDTYCSGGDGEITIQLLILMVEHLTPMTFLQLLLVRQCRYSQLLLLELTQKLIWKLVNMSIEVEARDVVSGMEKEEVATTSITRTITNDADESRLAAQVPDVTISTILILTIQRSL